MTGKLADRRDVGHFLRIRVQREVLRDLPNEDLAIFGGGSDDAVVEGVPGTIVSEGAFALAAPFFGRCSPVGIENSRRVAAEQGNLVGDLAPLFYRNDSEGAATRCIPIDG